MTVRAFDGKEGGRRFEGLVGSRPYSAFSDRQQLPVPVAASAIAACAAATRAMGTRYGEHET
jgi:hypothetical protein